MEKVRTHSMIGIIDDNKEICYMISEICKSREWIPRTGMNYPQAEELIDDDEIDLYLVDYYFPQCDGAEIVRKIRQHRPGVPIIALTGADNEEIMNRFMDAGVNDFALKPIRALDLISRVRAHLQYKASTQEYADVTKNISRQKADHLIEVFKKYDEYMDVETIAERSGITSRSVYRYIRYLLAGNILEELCNNDSKLGRPRTLYRFKKLS